MSDRDRVKEVIRAIQTVEAGLQTLREAGRHLPAVERNTVRMQGTLSALKAHFLEETAEDAGEADGSTTNPGAIAGHL